MTQRLVGDTLKDLPRADEARRRVLEGMRTSELNAATKSGTSGSGEEGDIENDTPDQVVDQHNVSIIGTKLGRRQTERVDSLPTRTPQ